MSKLNPRSAVRAPDATLARSYNGNPQFKKELHQELFELVVGFIYGRDTFYEKSDQRLIRLQQLIDKVVAHDGSVGARFVADVALFTREVGALRSAPIIALTELAKAMRARSIDPQQFSLREHVTETIQRVDELTDMYAYALSAFGGKNGVPLAVKKGVAAAFNKFDAYQFGKYDRETNLKLRDLLRIVHAKPSDAEHARIFNGLINGTLEAPLTHEVAFSVNGQLPKSERRANSAIWLEFLQRDRKATGSLGLLAVIRNLKRMAVAELSPAGWDLVADRLRSASDREVAKLLPFDLINSHRYAKTAGVPTHVLGALSALTERSFGALPQLGKQTLIVLDTSGSMNEAITVPHGQKQLDLNRPSMAACLFAAALLKQAALNGQRAELIRFSSDAEFLRVNPTDSVNTIYDGIMKRVHGGGTNLERALQLKQTLGWEPDAAFLLSDMQVDVFTGKRPAHTLWGQRVIEKPVDVTKYFTKSCRKVAFNFNSYESTPVGDFDGWFQLAGWSPNVFKYLTLCEHTTSMAEAIYALGPGAWRGRALAEASEDER